MAALVATITQGPAIGPAWLAVRGVSAVFLIFLAPLLPVTLTAIAASEAFPASTPGNRHDLPAAGTAMIGLIGLLLDVVLRRLEGFALCDGLSGRLSAKG